MMTNSSYDILYDRIEEYKEEMLKLNRELNSIREVIYEEIKNHSTSSSDFGWGRFSLASEIAEIIDGCEECEC